MGHKPISWSHIYATGSYVDGIFPPFLPAGIFSPGADSSINSWVADQAWGEIKTTESPRVDQSASVDRPQSKIK